MSHDHHHHEPAGGANQRRVGITLVLVVGYMVAEVIGGILSGSLALLADAGHMLSDAGALALTLFAMRVARRPPSKTHTFGYQRAEILGALANAAALVTICGHIIYQAIGRFDSQVEVRGGAMLGVAAGGLVVNLLSLALLHGGRAHSLSVRGAWLHVVADTLGSIGAVLAAVLIGMFGWQWADPVVSLLICALILYSAWQLVLQTIAVLMEAVPRSVDLDAVYAALTAVDGVSRVHDLHVWALTSGRNVVSAHVTLDDGTDRVQAMADAQRRLRELNLHHSTLQLDCDGTHCDPCDTQLTA